MDGCISKRISKPLAELIRPTTLDALAGQRHLLGPGKALRLSIENDTLHSAVFYGPPGVGKTSLVRLIEKITDLPFYARSALETKTEELREINKRTRESMFETKVVLFLDEIHYFNKKQQDILLPAVEEGRIILLGCTTQNPYFCLNRALLSRVSVYELKALEASDIEVLLTHAGHVLTQQLGIEHVIEAEVITRLAATCDGDARSAIAGLEVVCTQKIHEHKGEKLHISAADLEESTRGDKGYTRDNDDHFDMISALIKSMRGSDPDAALYWAFRMLKCGDDPYYLLRRLIIFAAEDVGNADPRALQIANTAFDAFERIGFPEGELIIAQAITYLASTVKSNASYAAMKAVKQCLKNNDQPRVPKHLRSLPTAASGYQYPHDFPGNWVAQMYLPESLKKQHFYEPVDAGFERQLGQRLRSLRKE